MARLSPLLVQSAENPAKEGWEKRRFGFAKDLLKGVDIDALFDPALDKEIEDLFYNGLFSPTSAGPDRYSRFAVVWARYRPLLGRCEDYNPQSWVAADLESCKHLGATSRERSTKSYVRR